MKNLKTLSNTWYNIAHTQITISLAHLSTYHSHTYQHIAHTSITISLTHLSPYRSHTYYHIAHTPITISLTHLSTWQLPWASAHSCPPADKKASFQIGWCALLTWCPLLAEKKAGNSVEWPKVVTVTPRVSCWSQSNI